MDAAASNDGWLARRRARSAQRQSEQERSLDAQRERALLDRLSAFWPDAEFRWAPEHRLEILLYVWNRDDRRCGICGGPTRLERAHLEHIVPKHIVYFDVADGCAVEGFTYASAYHHLSNLQAAHPACNAHKGPSHAIRDWRHATMPQVAAAADRSGEDELLLPLHPQEPHPRYIAAV